MRPLLVFGARPNFMKIAPIYRAMGARSGFDPVLLNTGQHFSKDMSDDFVTALEMPAPDINLGIGPGSQSAQVSEIMRRLEPMLNEVRPDVTVVVGDVSSTLAAALTSSMCEIPVAHVEAGLRSRDWRMPEECNRVLVDRVSTYLFTTSEDADDNLLLEGIEPHRVIRTGNVMIDSLDWVLPRIDASACLETLDLNPRLYGVITLHRPSNVDDDATLQGLLGALAKVSRDIDLVFPVHPRIRRRLSGFDTTDNGLRLLAPQGYSDFMALLANARLILTDSDGIQEEAVVLGVPCLTLRDNTERPITVASGINELVGTDPETIVEATHRRLRLPMPEAYRPPLWDGHAAERIVDALEGPAPAWPHDDQSRIALEEAMP